MSTGSPLIDRFLPRSGLRTDAINEWVGASDSSGAAILAMIAAATHLNSFKADGIQSQTTRFHVSGPLVVVDKEGTFYPPAAVALGISPKRIVWVRPKTHADHVWAIDQALRCEAVAAVWSHIGQQLNDRDARRFQLAAETGRTPGFLIRPAPVRGRPTFADVRFYCEQKGGSEQKGVRPLFPGTGPPGASQKRGLTPFCNSLPLQITIDRCRGGTTGQKIQVQIDASGHLQPVDLPTTTRQPDHHETATMHLAARLAHPTAAQSKTDARDDFRHRRA